MPRFRIKPDRNLDEVGGLIVAEWYRVLPDGPGNILPMDDHSLTAALNQLLVEPSRAVTDTADLVHIAIPYPPVGTKADLDDYLQRNSGFYRQMSLATIFGCGR